MSIKSEMGDEQENPTHYRQPDMLQALTPVVILITLLSLSVYLFGADSSYGPNQIALCSGAVVAALIGWKNGLSWTQIEDSMVAGISIAMKAILILYAVGLLIGSWILSGTVPTMIYYSLLILDPSIFYFATCVICAVVSLSIGSSWTTAGTVGVALIGAAAGLGLSVEITAGAIISGAYFGDKMSPLSDTTNLAPAVVGTDLFTHIHHMMWTTVPSIILALILFAIVGFNADVTGTAEQLQTTLQILDENFTINPMMLIPMVGLFFMARKKFPALPSILAGALFGLVFALVFQQQAIFALAGDMSNSFLALFKGVWKTMFDGYVSNTGNAEIDNLLSRGGMSSMLNTVWLIICAMVFGAIMDRTGLIKCLVNRALSFVNSTGSLILTTVATCIGTNIIASDQFIAIVIPGRMYKLEFQRRGLDVKNLSRTLEDSGTITSPLVPWNTCGAYMSATLGVLTFAYLPFCFFNLINPCVAVLYGFLNFKITALEYQEGVAT